MEMIMKTNLINTEATGHVRIERIKVRVWGMGNPPRVKGGKREWGGKAKATPGPKHNAMIRHIR
jgi:hypothetical protein